MKQGELLYLPTSFWNVVIVLCVSH